MPKKPSPLPPEVAALFAAWGARANTPHHQVCAHCGCSYVAKRPHSTYCRHSCAVAAGRQAKREATRTQKETS